MSNLWGANVRYDATQGESWLLQVPDTRGFCDATGCKPQEDFICLFIRLPVNRACKVTVSHPCISFLVWVFRLRSPKRYASRQRALKGASML